MRVAFLTYSLKHGGAERMVSRLANGMARRGHDVSIFVFDAACPSYQIDDAVSLIEIQAEKKKSMLAMPGQIRQIRRHIVEKDIQVLFCFMTIMVPYGVLADVGMHRKCKVVGAERGNPYSVKKWHQSVSRVFLPGCDGFVFQTDGAMDCYPKRLKAKGVVIGNIAPDIGECHDKRKVFPNAVYSVGRLHTDKDFATLLHAFQIVSKAVSQATLHIYGEGPLEGELKGLAKKLGIAGQVYFEGFTLEMAKEMEKYGVFAFSSKAEGMPNALLEAMSAGMACVSTDCDFGPGELIEDGIDGYLVPVGDYKAMAKRLVALLRDRQLRERIGLEAEKVKIKYAERKIVGKYLAYAGNIVRKKR